jgi:tetraacyldisaccharide 4'-kinase
VRHRNRRFDAGIGVERVEVPVISVGNLTLGGTGKTPMVEWLARWYEQRGVRVALVSRGYRAADGLQNDEAKELAEKLPGVPHVQNPKRVPGAREAIERHGAQLIVLDDGFQHRRLARDLDIVLVDALEPFGFERVFPRGMLREPLEGFVRAHVIALSRSDAVEAPARRAIHDRIRQYNPEALWLELVHQPRALRSGAGEIKPLEALAGRRLLAFCGIGNPAGFQHALDSCGYDVREFRAFPDHHAYTASDVEAMARTAARAKADAIICTHKDLVKVAALPGAGRALGQPLWALEVGMRIAAGQTEFEARLAMLADGR